mmetsp:Transcript_106957/g.190164  ORF Transcript_106957/g.190164 Transcript_106957/m.190164 type:complete len:693 (-) Transcript_106957:325-2403(-)
MASTRATVQLWLKERDEGRMIQTFDNLIRQHGLDALKEFRREQTRHEHFLVHELVHQGKGEVLKFLVQQHGFSLDVQRSSDQCTPLHLANWIGKEDLAAMLVEIGADPTITNKYGDSAGGSSATTKPINAVLTGANTAADILELINDRFADFGSDSLMYAFKLLGTKEADYDPVSCKYKIHSGSLRELHSSAAYQQLAMALQELVCQSPSMNGSEWSTMLRGLTALPDDNILQAMLNSLEEGRISCQGWHANHLATCMSALAKLGLGVRSGRPIAILGDALLPNVATLHAGDLIRVVWTIGEMRIPHAALLSCATSQVLHLPSENNSMPQALSLASWAHIRTASSDKDMIIRLAAATKEHVGSFTVNMNITLSAWCFAKAELKDEALFSAIFAKASVSMYSALSRHHERISHAEKLMSIAQMFFAYRFCETHCPGALLASEAQLQDDLRSISEVRSGASPQETSLSSELRIHMKEINSIIENLGRVGDDVPDMRFEKSMEMQAGHDQARHVADGNAARSEQLLGMMPTPAGHFVLLEFKRDPECFHKALLTAEILQNCRADLDRHGHKVQLESGAKLFVSPGMYEHACEVAEARSLKPRHVLLEPKFEAAVMSAVENLPSNQQVRLKPSRGDNNILVFVLKHPQSPRGPYRPSKPGVNLENSFDLEVHRTFLEIPLPSSLHSGLPVRATKSA